MSDGAPLEARDGGRRDVACVGDNCVDVLRSRGGAEVAGGNAFNVAVALARRARTVSYFGAVGEDAHAGVILDAARSAGVDVTGVERRPGPTGVTIVDHAANGERTFVREDYGVAAEYRTDGIPDAALAAHSWFHVARQPDVAALVARVRAAAGGESAGTPRVRVSYDAGDHTPPAGIALVAPLVDVLFISAADPAQDAQRVAVEAQSAGAPLVVVTSGERGAIAGEAGGSWSQPALPVPRVVDTLGAGDAFIAGFISSLLDHDADIGLALGAGAAAGAAVVGADGSRRTLTTTEVSP